MNHDDMLPGPYWIGPDGNSYVISHGNMGLSCNRSPNELGYVTLTDIFGGHEHTITYGELLAEYKEQD